MPSCRFQPWPEDALEAVATKFLREVDVTAQQRAHLMALCKTIHTSVEQLSTKFKTAVSAHVPSQLQLWSCLPHPQHPNSLASRARLALRPPRSPRRCFCWALGCRRCHVRSCLTQTGRHNYVTPTSYLELITMFTTLLAAKRHDVLSAQQRYETGLDKLDFTAEQVR